MITPTLCAPIDRLDCDESTHLDADDARREFIAFYRGLSPTEKARVYRDAVDPDRAWIDEYRRIHADLALAMRDTIVANHRARKHLSNIA